MRGGCTRSQACPTEAAGRARTQPTKDQLAKHTGNQPTQACVMQTEGRLGAERWRQLQGEARDSTDPRAQLRSDREDGGGRARMSADLSCQGCLEPYCGYREWGDYCWCPQKGTPTCENPGARQSACIRQVCQASSRPSLCLPRPQGPAGCGGTPAEWTLGKVTSPSTAHPPSLSPDRTWGCRAHAATGPGAARSGAAALVQL